MSPSDEQATGKPQANTQPSLPDDALPPVEAPSAGFILQLFLIPMIIVSIIVMVWLTFSWLAHMGSNPRDLVRGMKKGDDAAWQKAGILADLLRDQRKEHMKYDKALAKEVADALENQIQEGSKQQHQIKLRIFLCRALGEFRITDVLPALLTAATTERDEAEIEAPNPTDQNQRKLTEIDVRLSALEAIATLVSNVGSEQLQEHEQLMKVLVESSAERGVSGRDEHLRRELRSKSAFALGVLGGDKALARLERILGDPYPNARFNAATGLARHGDVRAIPELVDMLDPENQDAVADEQHQSGIAFKRSMVITNGIQAALMLGDRNQTDDLQELANALAKLSKADVPVSVRVKAKEAMTLFQNRKSQ